MKKIVLATAALMVIPITAHAADVFDAGGTAKGTNKSQREVISEGHMLMNSSTTYDSFTSTDPNSPFNGMTGSCWGVLEIKTPAISGQGNCVFTDPSGDKNYNSWTPKSLTKDGTMAGTWSMLGGTGKYKNATGGGTFASNTNRETGATSNEVKGAMTLK